MKKIKTIIEMYDSFYSNTLSIRQKAICNQKIAIANIVTITNRINSKEISPEEVEKNEQIRIACAQKKLDYSVIIEECGARIEWCIQNMEKDLQELFTDNKIQMEVYKYNIFEKLKRLLFNKLLGKTKYRKLLENYKKEYLPELEEKSNIKIINIAYTLKGVIKQMNEVNNQININYQLINK